MSDSATKDSYSALAGKYDDRWQKYLSHTHDTVIEHLRISPNSTILDISCGTGLFQKKLIEKQVSFKNMVMNDLSRGMLEISQSRFSELERFSFTNQHAESLSFTDNSFDIILCLSSFHNYKDQKTVCSEIYRVLKPGGTIYILDWNNSGFFKFINLLLDWSNPEIINTKSATEVVRLLKESSFNIAKDREWWFGRWKFFLISAEK
jgi:ubiquinone/menaquinone biosynthesis C-methylase UbiE